MKAQSREVPKATKYQELCHTGGMFFLSVVFESQDLAGQRYLEHFDNLIVQRADEIEASVAPLKIYWNRRLSVTLQHIAAEAINIRKTTLYTGPTGPIAVDESA